MHYAKSFMLVRFCEVSILIACTWANLFDLYTILLYMFFLSHGTTWRVLARASPPVHHGQAEYSSAPIERLRFIFSELSWKDKGISIHYKERRYMKENQRNAGMNSNFGNMFTFLHE